MQLIQLSLVDIKYQTALTKFRKYPQRYTKYKLNFENHIPVIFYQLVTVYIHTIYTTIFLL